MNHCCWLFIGLLQSPPFHSPRRDTRGEASSSWRGLLFGFEMGGPFACFIQGLFSPTAWSAKRRHSRIEQHARIEEVGDPSRQNDAMAQRRRGRRRVGACHRRGVSPSRVGSQQSGLFFQFGPLLLFSGKASRWQRKQRSRKESNK